MAVPAFSFTSRAVPIAQIGRPDPLDPTSEVWVDIGCDVHEITTDTGRGSISDRFVPGTATITASNVSGWASGVVPLAWSYFVDEFARSGPALGSHWEEWVALETDQDADGLVLVDEAAEVQAHVVGSAVSRVAGDCELVDTAHAFGGSATTASIGGFTGIAAGDMVAVAIAAANEAAVSPITIPGWSNPEALRYVGAPDGTGWQYKIFVHWVTAEEAATGDPWTATWLLAAAWSWVGWVIRGAGSVQVVGADTREMPTVSAGFYWAPVNVLVPPVTPVAGCIGVRIVGGNSQHAVTPITGFPITEFVQSTSWTSTHLLAFDNGGVAMTEAVTLVDRQWDWTSAAAAPGEWASGGTFLFVPGSPPDEVSFEGASCAMWGLDYAGDQFIDTVVSGLQAPDRMWPSASATVQLWLNANSTDLAGRIASFHWVPDWDDPTTTLGTLSWSVLHSTSGGGVFTLISGSHTYGPEGIPAAVRFRFESDSDNQVRVYLDSTLLGSGSDSHGAVIGQRVGIYSYYTAGSLSYGHTHRMGPPRFERVVAGSNIPVPIYLEPGVLVRIGVDHQSYGFRWFFHGYVDAIVPTYDPTRHATAQIECIDALGEVGRQPVADIGGVDPEEAWERVTRLLDETSWPVSLRDIADDATWMDNGSAAPDRAIELLTQTAESCGGAVYGDPATGHVVFRARDWQAWDPDAPPDGYITNGPHPDGVLAVCPSTWERSWKREEMTTRVHYTGGTYVHTGVREEGFYSNPDAEARFGVEAYDRSLNCIELRILNKLGRRQLRLRGPGAFPRVNAVLLDAATGESAVDVMTVSTFTAPSRYVCGLIIDGATVFDRQFLVTGVRHTISRDRWQCRLELDIADVFATKGARWGRGHWGIGVWGHSI